VLSLAVAIGFFCSEVIVLVVFLALGAMLSAAATSDAALSNPSSILSTHEAIRALGASILFIILSGYLVSLATLCAIFRARLLSLTHATWVTLLFVLHAGFFLFYLRAPAVLSSSLMLVAVGVVCVIAAVATEYFLWRKWLLPRGRLM
jgi:hypothetical protein